MFQLLPTDNSITSCACMIIVRDAEKYIEKCLNSVLKTNCFDQVICILDDRSKDQTADILAFFERFNPGFLVKSFTWSKNDFSAARNEAFKYVQTKYAFWLDSDDVILDDHGIKALLKYPAGKAYYFKVLLPQADGFSTVDHIRLFPMFPGIKWELPVHEQIAFSIRSRGIEEVKTPYRILHLGYTDPSEIGKKHKRNLEIMTRYLQEHQEDTPQTRYIRERYNVSMLYEKARSGQ